MESKIPFVLWLTCVHCKQKTLLFRNMNETTSKCANGDCAKISTFDENEKVGSYITSLENKCIDLKKKVDNIPSSIPNEYLLKTNDGHRLVLLERNSIQWVLTQNIKHLI